jgi:hypothetical protein
MANRANHEVVAYSTRDSGSLIVGGSGTFRRRRMEKSTGSDPEQMRVQVPSYPDATE